MLGLRSEAVGVVVFEEEDRRGERIVA